MGETVQRQTGQGETLGVIQQRLPSHKPGGQRELVEVTLQRLSSQGQHELLEVIPQGGA